MLAAVPISHVVEAGLCWNPSSGPDPSFLPATDGPLGSLEGVSDSWLRAGPVLAVLGI